MKRVGGSHCSTLRTPTILLDPSLRISTYTRQLREFTLKFGLRLLSARAVLTAFAGCLLDSFIRLMGRIGEDRFTRNVLLSLNR